MLGAFWVLLVSAAAFAGDLDTVIVPPAEPAQAGRVAEFTVYVHNTGDEIVTVHLPNPVTCRIKSSGQTVETVAEAVRPYPETPAAVGKDNFIKRRYAFTIPANIAGPVRMEIREFNAAGVMFAVAAAEPPKAQTLGAAGSDSPEDYPTLDALFSLYQPYLVNLAAHEPMYFLVGTKPEKSKFQISFKYRFLNPKKAPAQDHPWMKGLHFGYTQTSYWDLKSDSLPFEDTSYKPELFFLSSNIKARPAWLKGFFFQTGFQHESNGRGGELSRSTNFLYANPIFIFYDKKSRLGLQVAPKIWAYVKNDDKTNADLEDYRGYFDLELKFGKADSFVLGSHLRWADQGASVQLDLTCPLHRFPFDALDVYFQAQYVNTLAESLLNFRERSEVVRLGFAIVR